MSFTERYKEYRQKHRENRQRKIYESPVKKAERAPIARGLMDVIKVCLDNTPEYLRAPNQSRVKIGEDRETETIPVEFDTDDGHFSVLKVNFQNPKGTTTEGYSLTFKSKAEPKENESNSVVLKVAVVSNTPVKADAFGHLYVGPLPYDIGNFSFTTSQVQLDSDILTPNSPQTRDAIFETVRMLLPTLDRNRANNVSER